MVSDNGSALSERTARASHRAPSGSAIKSKLFAAIVVSSFKPVAWPTPTKNPASSNVARIIVLREYVVSAHGRAGSSARKRFSNRGNVHIAGFFAGEKAS